MKHVIKYEYDGEENLKSVTQPSETALRWQFVYEAGTHQLKELIDGRGNKTLMKYENHKVVEETDPLGHVTTFEYKPLQTRTENKATKAIIVQYLTNSGLATSVTHGVATTHETTETSTYNQADELLRPLTAMADTTTYNTTVMATEKARLTQKVTKRNGRRLDARCQKPKPFRTEGSRPTYGKVTAIRKKLKVSAPEAETKVTAYTYYEHGKLKTVTNPLGRVWEYKYDSQGDRSAETDPENDERTWGYNTDSQETSTVSPRGHETGATESKFKTETVRNARGLPEKVIAPLKHETLFKIQQRQQSRRKDWIPKKTSPSSLQGGQRARRNRRTQQRRNQDALRRRGADQKAD